MAWQLRDRCLALLNVQIRNAHRHDIAVEAGGEEPALRELRWRDTAALLDLSGRHPQVGLVGIATHLSTSDGQADLPAPARVPVRGVLHQDAVANAAR